jgi:hypothetical protein
MSLELEERLHAVEIELEKYKNSGYWTRRDVLKGIGLTGVGLLGLSQFPSTRAADLSFDLSGSVPKLTSHLDFNYYKAIAMSCDNGATLPTSPVVGTWFLHTPTGRNILMMYGGSSWISIISLGTTTLYVSTTGTNDQSHGTGTGTDAFLTIQYAIDAIPGMVGGNVTINTGAGNFNSIAVIQGKNYSGNYSITIQGTLPAASVTSTATSGSAYAMGAAGYGAVQAALNDTGKSWTVGTVADSGTTDGATVATFLDQSGQNFLTTVQVGMTVHNITDDTWTQVVRVVSNTRLLLRDDICPTAKAFEIGWGQYSNCLLVITGGTGAGQERIIDSNYKTKLKIVGTWDTTPANDSTYAIYDLSTGGTTIDRTGSGASEKTFEQNAQKNIIYKYLNIKDWGDYGIFLHKSSNSSIYSCMFRRNRITNCNAAIDARIGSELNIYSSIFIDEATTVGRQIRVTQFSSGNIYNLKFFGGSQVIVISAQSICYGTGLCIRSSVTYSIRINSFSRFDIEQSIMTNTTRHIHIDGSSYLVLTSNFEISSATSDGIRFDGLCQCLLTAPSTVQINYNGGWGVNTTNISYGAGVSGISYTGNVSGTYTADATSVNT